MRPVEPEFAKIFLNDSGLGTFASRKIAVEERVLTSFP